MDLKKTIFQKMFVLGLAVSFAFTFASCDDSDTPDEDRGTRGNIFISANALTSNESEVEYLLMAEDATQGSISTIGNGTELELSGYTWIFNNDPSVALGLIYRQGEPGIGLAYSLTPDGALRKEREFQVSTRFTSYGFFENYALTSVGGITPTDENGNALLDDEGNPRTDGVTFTIIDMDNNFSLSTKTIQTQNITGNGDQATFSGIVDMGNGEFLTGLVVSQPRDPDQGGGASTGPVTYPDSVWVAALDADLNVTRIYRDDRLSYASGRFRSQYYSQIGKADDGTVYVFSGSYESTTTKPAGALKINRNADDFDDTYYFNIEAQSDGYKFRKVWHITGNYFLLEFYNEQDMDTNTAATQYGVVDVAAQSFEWVTGIPNKDNITGTGQPSPIGGRMYFPITADGEAPAIYVIDPATAVATKGLELPDAASIRAIGRLRN